MAKKSKKKKTGLDLIVEERNKHAAIGYDQEHDSQHGDGQLAVAAAQLACAGTNAAVDAMENDDMWLLIANHPDRVEQLTIAGALIAAEIDRKLKSK